MGDEPQIVIAGAGPAGLAAAYDLARRGIPSLLLEAADAVGGLSRTYEFHGHRFDVGGHRFFTRNPQVLALWREVLGDEFLLRRRLSRIYYRNHLFRYPLSPGNAMAGMGLWMTLRALASLLVVRLRPIRPERSFADWVTNRFGRVLYEMFFRTYTEKVWGIPHDRISADWAAQRIRNLSLSRAVLDAFRLGRRDAVASLVEEFHYPRLGPGQMYDAMARAARQAGSVIRFSARVTRVHHDGARVLAITTQGPDGTQSHQARHLLSSIPIDELVRALDPPPPEPVLAAAAGLRHRAMVAVNLVVDRPLAVPDNWIYLHAPDVRAARMQFFRNWSPDMAPDPATSPVGLEYFCFAGDDLWSRSETEMVALARRDLERLSFLRGMAVIAGMVVRAQNAYPVYQDDYVARLATLRGWLSRLTNLDCIGRGGQFRYNNMDHAILTGLLAVRRMMGETVDPWAVNEEALYIE